MIANTPAPPYYAVIFSSIKHNDEGYAEMAERMNRLASQQPGFLGMESARNEIGITVSYWKDEDSIRKWKADLEHVVAQRLGRTKWYNSYRVRVCHVEREYGI